MIYSMTGFARSHGQGDWGVATWELRSVNHRYLEVSLRLPENLRTLENAVRETLRSTLARGKVDAILKFVPGPALEGELTLNEALLHQLSKANSQITEQFGDGFTVNTIDVLKWPGLIQENTEKLSTVHAHILDVLNEGISKLKEMRGKEGDAINGMLVERLDKIEALVEDVRKIQPELKDIYRENMLAKLAEVSEKLDSDRLEQEMIFYAQRMDVAEELDRLDAHVAEIRKVLDRKEPVGRRLDFFMQELNREANTLTSKSQSKPQTHASVDIKVLIEQMREQVQNIE